VVRATAEDLGEHSFEGVLLDESGNQVTAGAEGTPVGFSAPLNVQAPSPPNDWPSSNPFALSFVGLPLQPGKYRFEIRVDDVVLETVPFKVLRRDEGAS
jgi:hypothetical protein